MKKIININDCKFSYDGKKNIVNINQLDINEGEHIFLKGKSGSGKTTFLNLLCGVLSPDSGSIKVLDTELTKLSQTKKDKFRADNYGVVFQHFNLLPYLSVYENITLPLNFSKQKQQKALDIDELLFALGLDSQKKEQKAMNLSVGEQQRVALARAIVGSPKIIVADEPTSALDSNTKDSFMKLLFQQLEKNGSTLVFVSHDDELSKHFEKVYDFCEISR